MSIPLLMFELISKEADEKFLSASPHKPIRITQLSVLSRTVYHKKCPLF